MEKLFKRHFLEAVRKYFLLGGDDACRLSRHLGGRSRWISVSLRPTLSTKLVQGQLELYRETLSH